MDLFNMDEYGSDHFTLVPRTDGAMDTILAEEPVNRARLQTFIANARAEHYGGIHVPFRVVFTDLRRGTTIVEHVPGCACCDTSA